ncbi:hypothetical protein Tco_0672946 [Tanacetum coccineum]
MEHAEKHQEPKYTIVSSDVDHKALYHALMMSILEDEDAMDKGVADKLKKRKPDDDIDEGPPAGPDQGLKRKKIGKETEPSKKAKSTGASKEDMGNTDDSHVVNVDPKDWFKKTERPPTPDPEWNEEQTLQPRSYQKKLNISKPRTREEDLSRRSPYTTLSDPQGVIYEAKMNRKRLMHSDELYKFSDGILQSVQDTFMTWLPI